MIARSARLLRVCLLACLSLSLKAGCAAREELPAPGEASEWLAQVRDAHATADAALLQDDAPSAARALREALDANIPEAVLPQDRRVVQQDLLYRLSSVQLESGRPAAALAAAERGLALGPGEDIFRANLLVVQGEALQAAGRDTEAAASYYAALMINRALLADLLETPGKDAAP